VGPYYVRSLNDYEDAFHDIQDRYSRCVEATRRTQRDVDALKSTIVKTQEQIAYRQDERNKLQQDQQGFERDKITVTELVAKLESQRNSLRDELSSLFKGNLALDQQLTEYNAKLTEEINRRAADVATIQAP
jgi:chromosome segregation ATPase